MCYSYGVQTAVLKKYLKKSTCDNVTWMLFGIVYTLRNRSHYPPGNHHASHF